LKHHGNRPPAGSGEETALRLDKWLWAARFFKTRGLAAEAIQGGRVHLNGKRVKPARSVRIGDRLEIHKGEVRFELEVAALSRQRRPAPEARRLYAETEASLAQRQALLARRQAEGGRRLGHPGRPDRRQRRQARRLRGRE